MVTSILNFGILFVITFKEDQDGSYLSGWISVFNCFDNEGKYIGTKFDMNRLEDLVSKIINGL